MPCRRVKKREGLNQFGEGDAMNEGKGSWMDDYKTCRCGHKKVSHITAQDAKTKEMVCYCTHCDCHEFKEKEK
jgi:hypothetical protein